VKRLNAAAWARSERAQAGYDREQWCGVVHLGTGAFHRAHQAVFFDDLLAVGEPGWMIRGASLRSSTVAAQLNPQDGLFTVLVCEGDRRTPRIVGSVSDVLVAPENPSALVDALANSDVSLVTLTITEKGYCIDPASGALKTDDDAVRQDIETGLAAPVTAPGFLVAGLRARRAQGLPPFTVLSCDNLPDNGHRTRAAVLAMAQAVDPELAAWIETEGAFPSSMVDRIVPATTEQDIAALEALTGYRDEAMVKTEPFTQWVVEDWFVSRRPPLEQVGVQFTTDVAAWEKAKLRLLNGAHSALAYLGALAGHLYVHEAIAAPGFAHFIDVLWDEAQSTLDPIDGFDPAEYRRRLLDRFSNAALRHRTVQIAMDGSQKLPQRLLTTIRARLSAGQSFDALALGVAGWVRWQYGEDEHGRPYVVDDPLARETRARVESGRGDPTRVVEALLDLDAVFAADLRHSAAFRDAVSSALSTLLSSTAVGAVARFTQSGGS
jgi:fructuronate reductase